jgi:Co/Zn/Cd efflux system component
LSGQRHGSLHRWPVMLAGLSFLLLAAVLLPTGRILGSASVVALGAETAFDGLFYLFGGAVSGLLDRSSFHSLYCYARESVELAALGSGLVFVVTVLTQPNTGTGGDQALVGVAGALVAVVAVLYWHPHLDAHGHHGFDWHLIADVIMGAAVAAGSIVAWITERPAANYWIAVAGSIIALIFSLRPGWRIVGRLWHRPSHHPAKDSSH